MGVEINDSPENAAVMKMPFAQAIPTHMPLALRQPLIIAVRAMRKKSTPGINRARKCATATARNCSISAPETLTMMYLAKLWGGRPVGSCTKLRQRRCAPGVAAGGCGLPGRFAGRFGF
ncbi:hypothetical protein ABT282_37290 [Streptomyces sp. NPDC000927]|uniref:hypothetical protein n=1 Tax=unclassified Streptomyces TaxID=2593676 RepID=UPI00331E0C89